MANAAALPLLLRQLRLPTMAGCCLEVTERALKQGWSIPQTLAALCEYELAERERRRLERHLKEARLPVGKTLESFEFDAIAGADRHQLSALACEVGWIEQARNLLLFGPSGVGKSHLAAAIGQALIEQGQRVRYYAASTLVQELQVAKQALRLADALSKLDKYGLLVIDDIGYVKRTESETSVLFELIAHRYEAGSLLITSNQPFSAWDSVFPDDMMAVAAIDRLIHHAFVVELTGESYRKRAHTRQRKEQKSTLES
ncbi:DNA replication protein DnaC [Natronocella acetinitrilica]|uniref:DNA replication protein DnaC n=1 Tax=Natronocella acetinitrilica TaxID=414046 RepID=A0AAE3KDX0_9GAMM|nr:IS21-like element helper ATPase IstB [Natronocella acetinitrilica]MCP1677299.1 DNA replication protein DnaC [Natronocella acetinitrilica]